MGHKIIALCISVLLIYILVPINALSESEFESESDSDEDNAPLVFLGNQSLPPMVYIENNTPKGIVVDITKALGEKMGQPISIQAINWAEAQKIVEQGGADALIQINETEQRKKIYDFSEPLLESKFSIFVLSKRVGITGASDLRGLTVGVEKNGLPALVLKEDSLVQLVDAPSILEAFHMLAGGDIDAVVVDKWVGEYILAVNNLKGVQPVGSPIAVSYSAIAVKKGNVELLSQINQALREIKEDGTYDSILKRWAPMEIVFQTRDQIKINQYRIGITLLVIIILITIIWTLVLIRQLNKSKQMEKLLAKERRRLFDIIEATNVGTWEYNIDTNDVVINDRWTDIIGYTLKEISLFNIENWISLINVDDNQRINDQSKRVYARELDHFDIECRLKHKNGNWVWIHFIGNVILWTADGEPLLIGGTSTDITERKHWEETLKENEEKYRLLTENASDVIWVFNLDTNKFTYVSPAVFYLRGFTAEEMMAESLEEAFAHESISIIKDTFKKTSSDFINNPKLTTCYILEVQQPCKNGDIIWVEVSAKYRYNSKNQIEIIGVSRNIDNRRKSQEEILYLSYHDQLTGLYNRRFYEEELHRLDIERNYPLTIIMSDVNGLKLVNDSFGHAVGDELLKRVAQLLTEKCRSNDIIARLGGDEFVILLPETDSTQAEQLIKRIKDITAAEKIGSIDISISFGWETKSTPDGFIQDIFKKAEDQMYRRKLFDSPNMRRKTIDAIIHTLHEKIINEEQHSHRVSALCKGIGEALALPENKIEELKSVGFLHDIGKIAINEEVLNKQGELTEEEWKEIYRHPEIGYRILSTVNDMSEMAEYVLYHHERWDGKGYPKGLKGEEIPFISRIIAIADAYDAITGERNYRSSMSQETAIQELKENAGTQFDYTLVKVFIEKVINPT